MPGAVLPQFDAKKALNGASLLDHTKQIYDANNKQQQDLEAWLQAFACGPAAAAKDMPAPSLYGNNYFQEALFWDNTADGNAGFF